MEGGGSQIKIRVNLHCVRFDLVETEKEWNETSEAISQRNGLMGVPLVSHLGAYI